MEAIKNYLDNIFANLPKTNQLTKLKDELLSNMEEKFNELRKNGKNDYEALGIVISEFGNIEELISDLGINCERENKMLPVVSEEDVKEYMEAKELSGKLLGLGAFLCIMAPAILILITLLAADGILGKGVSEDTASIFGVIGLFLMLAVSAGIFIYNGMRMDKYKYLKEDFELPLHVKAFVELKNKSFSDVYALSVIMGVCLCILSPVPLFIESLLSKNQSGYGVVFLLAIIAVAVYIFIYYGEIRESYGRLLKVNEFTEEKKKTNKVIWVVASVVWPLAACIFLISGLVYEQWHINWIVFPITGILFGAFCGAYGTVKRK